MRKDFFVNERIWAKELRVIDKDGQQIGVLNKEEALSKAREAGLDLVMVSAEAKPPVCRIINFGKFKYEITKKEKESKKTHHAGEIKELKLNPKIGEHDFQVRVKKADELLRRGYKIKVLVLFRGREAAHPEFGIRLIEKMIDSLKDIAQIESKMHQDRRFLVVNLVPKHA